MDKVVHFEIPAMNVERAQKFYSSVFDWKITAMPEMKYTIVSTGPTSDEGMPSEPGFINGGLMEKKDPLTSPIITISVADIQQAITEIKKAGGTLIKEPVKVADMGLSAYFKDPEGNLMGLWQNLSS